MSDDRPGRYIEGDRIIYRASALGGCPRALMLTGLGYTGEPWGPWFQAVLDEGTRMEDAILGAYTAKTGHEVVDHQREYDLQLLENVWVRCHIDGRYPHKLGDGGELIIDAKKVRPSGWEEFGRRGVEMHAHWIWQVAAIQHATKCSRFDLVGGLYRPATDEREEGIDDVMYHSYSDPVLPLKALRKKVLAVEELIEANPDPGSVPCEPKMYPCPYHAFHDTEEVPDVSKMEGVEVLRALRKQYEDADARREAMKVRWDTAEAERRAAGQGIVAWLESKAEELGLADAESWQVELDGQPVKITYTKGGSYTRKASRSYRHG